ncbi:Presequence translocated-associated motor subunit pam17, mitochondrial [Talaromyces islandicus]|uniref:Presequence translocated-associated motor subunit PAM17, mitochondrial n=1 Tax=Talaromyces islandicus TaxID=28573 RepID=A0A0U1M6J1_TALIS|nr:Presequence translocated-associated motor subunit pam17, mitochondrial [Talaromyces islandicus]
MPASKVPNTLIHKHPLQRLQSPSRSTSAAIHFLGLLSFGSSFKYLVDNPNFASDSYGWHFVFLTILGLSVSTLAFAVGFLADITLSRRLFLLKNLLSVCSVPLEALISLLYWGIRAIDPSYVLREDDIIPFHVDLGFHLMPTLFLLFDLLYLSPPWTITAMPAIGISTCIAFCYWFWIEKCYSMNGWYPYPLMELLDTKGRIALFSAAALVMAINIITLKWLYGRVNGFGRDELPTALSGDIKTGDYHTNHVTRLHYIIKYGSRNSRHSASSGSFTSRTFIDCITGSRNDKMHAGLMNTPLRTAMLGSSRFSCGLAPFVYSGSATSFTQQQQPPSSTASPAKNNSSSRRGFATFSTQCKKTRPAVQAQLRKQNPMSTSLSQISISCKRTFTRSANVSAKSTRAKNAATGAAAAATKPQDGALDWNTFFKLRTSRRRYSLVSSILASLASTAVGVQVLSAQDVDTLGAQVMGLDPFIVLGLATAACGALGWLAGPVLGNTAWGLVNRRYRGGVAIKEKEFFHRIKRYRVDPSANSIANPVPDYYGEKIGSVQGYRQWLKDQRAYNRKKSRAIL